MRCYALDVCFLLGIASAIPVILGGCVGVRNECPNDASCACDVSVYGVAMDCSKQGDNALTAVPSPLPSNLVSLKAVKQMITEIRKKDFENCSNLQLINLSDNNITQVDPGSFEHLVNLTKLAINMNLIDFSNYSSFPYGALDTLINLKELWIDLNKRGSSVDYRSDIFQHKPRLIHLTIDGIPGVSLPKLYRGTLSNLTHLRIYNGLKTLSPSIFKNWRALPLQSLHVHSITINSNDQQLERIEPESCSTFPSLIELDLNYNPSLGFNKSLYQCLEDLKRIQVKQLRLIGVVKDPMSTPRLLPRPFINLLKELNLTALNLDWNGIDGLGGSLRESMPTTIERLSLSYNRFFGRGLGILRQLQKLPHLQVLDFSEQSRLLSLPPIGASYSSTVQRPKRSAVRGRYNPYGYNPKIPIRVLFPKTLTELHLSDVFGDDNMDISSIMILGAAPEMTLIDLSNNRLNIIEGPLILFDKTYRLQTLNLSGCGLQRLGYSFFHKDYQIDSLDLSRNIDFGNQITDDINGQLMAHMEKAKVKTLNMSLTNIKYIPPYFFSQIFSLEVLILRDAAVSAWYDDLRHMTKLSVLDFSRNRFLYLRTQTYDDIDFIGSKHSFSLDMSHNPIQLECDNIHFLQWLLQTKVHLVEKQSITFIHNGQKFNDTIFFYEQLPDHLLLLEVECAAKTFMVATSVGCGVAMIFLCIAVVIHRQRWDIRYFCLRLVRERKQYRTLRPDEDHEFDAFVVYHSNDIEWVKHMLIPKIEGDAVKPLRLCIHQRDWVPGNTIEDNICSSVDKSRKTIVILTKNFIKSSWCEFEMQMARMRSINEGEDIIIVVALEDIGLSEMSRTLVNLRRTSTWLEWDPDNREEQDIFWNRLRQAISCPSEQPTRCWCGRTFYPDGTTDMSTSIQ